MSRPLDGVEEKLRRARHHLGTFHETSRGIFEDDPIRFHLEPDVESGCYFAQVEYVPPTPLLLSVIVGEILYNLRSALDHVVWQLALRQTSKPSRNLQFPIVGSPAEFRDQCFRISLLPAAEQALIESFQPYKRGNEVSPLRRLSIFSNLDKHRVLNPVLHIPVAVGLSFMGQRGSVVESVQWLGTGKRLKPGTQIARLEIRHKGEEPHVQMKGNVVPDVEFEDGWSVDVELMRIGSEVVRIAEAFEPILEPQDVALPFRFQHRPWANFHTLP